MNPETESHAGASHVLARLRRVAFLCGALLLAAGELAVLAVILELVTRWSRGPRAQGVLFAFAVLPAIRRRA